MHIHSHIKYSWLISPIYSHPSLNQPEPERIAEREKLIMGPIGKDLTGNKKRDHEGEKKL